MPTTNARQGAGAMPDERRSTLWGSVTNALGHVTSNITAAWYDTWKRVPGFPTAQAQRQPMNVADGRYGDPVGLGDVRSSPVLRAGPEPRALDQSGGNRENRVGMPADARASSWPWLVAAGLVGVLLLSRR